MRYFFYIIFIYSISLNAKTVTDNNTSLMWEDTPNIEKTTWKDAFRYCSNLTLDNYNDWRVPNINELETIIDQNRFNPSVKSTFKHTKSSIYWSSSEFKGDPSKKVLVVYFYNGFTDWGLKSASFYIRCVRDIK